MLVQQQYTNIQHWSLTIQYTALHAEFTWHNAEHSYTMYAFLPPFPLYFHSRISSTVKLIPPIHNCHNCGLSYTIQRLMHCQLVQLCRYFAYGKKICLTLETGHGKT